MTTNTATKTKVADLARQLIAGTDKHLAGVTQVLLSGGSFTPTQVTERLKALVQLRDDVDAARASTKAKLALEKAEMPPLRTHMDAFVAFVKAAFGSKPDVLADFGLHPKTRASLTIEAKAAAAAKRKATRAARHTMGTQQKKSVKGAVTGIVLTPIVAAPLTAMAPTGANAPAASTGATPRPT